MESPDVLLVNRHRNRAATAWFHEGEVTDWSGYKAEKATKLAASKMWHPVKESNLVSEVLETCHRPANQIFIFAGFRKFHPAQRKIS